MEAKITIFDFSPHLFWEVYKSKLDFEKNKEQIVYQVVEYGLMHDWLLLQKVYPPEKLKAIATSLRALDKKTLSYLAHHFNVEKTEFRCYTESQSPQNFWNS